MEADDIDGFLETLRAHPQRLREEDGKEVWLHDAAFQGKIDFAKALLNLGVKVTPFIRPRFSERQPDSIWRSCCPVHSQAKTDRRKLESRVAAV